MSNITDRIQLNTAEAAEALDFKTKFPLADDEQINELVALDKGTLPVEAFFQNPERSNFGISPNGKYLGWLAPYENRRNIHVQEIGTKEVKRITHRTDRDIPGWFWADDDQLVYMQDNGGDENYHIFLAKRDGSSEKDMTPYDGVKAEIIDDLKDVPNEMIVSMNKREPQLFEPYRLNLLTGELTLLAENLDLANPIMGYMTDHDGKIRVAMRLSGGVNSTILYRDNEEEEFRAILTTNFKNTFSTLFFTFDNKELYCSSNMGRDKTAIVRFDPVEGKEVSVLYENPDYDVSSLSYSRRRKVLTGISYTSWKREVIFLDKEIEFVYNRLYKELPNYEVVISDMDDAENMYVVRTYSDRSLGSYYLYNKTADTLVKLADVNDKLKEEEMVEMKPITYTSRDGLTIHGYLTLPKGKEAKNLPVIINPHGGPWARDSWGFNPEVQLFANRGYAVFKMNFRGSTGFGRSFWQASFKQWGKTMQDDVTDGVNWLIEQGIADPNRVAIYGGSYGGYATLAGVAFTPDLYKCAIDYVGVSNLFTFMETIPPYWKPLLDTMYEMVGHPIADKVELEATSPAFHVDKIKAPLFVIQGAKDPRVNIDESDQIVKALRAKGVNVPYLVKENEGHGFSNQENRFEAYKAMSGFFKKYIG